MATPSAAKHIPSPALLARRRNRPVNADSQDVVLVVDDDSDNEVQIVAETKIPSASSAVGKRMLADAASAGDSSAAVFKMSQVTVMDIAPSRSISMNSDMNVSSVAAEMSRFESGASGEVSVQSSAAVTGIPPEATLESLPPGEILRIHNTENVGEKRKQPDSPSDGDKSEGFLEPSRISEANSVGEGASVTTIIRVVPAEITPESAENVLPVVALSSPSSGSIGLSSIDNPAEPNSGVASSSDNSDCTNSEITQTFAATSKQTPIPELIPSTSGGVPASGLTVSDDDDSDEEEEVEPHEEVVPLSAIAKLSLVDRARLKQLQKLNRKFNARIDQLDTNTPDSKAYVTELKELEEFRVKNRQVLEEIVKLCKLDENSGDQEAVLGWDNFRFRGSGYIELNKILTKNVRENFGGITEKGNIALAGSTETKGISEKKCITEKTVKDHMEYLAERYGLPLVHSKTGRKLSAETVFINLLEQIERFRKLLSNRNSIPAFTDPVDDGTVRYDGIGEQNPSLPDDPKLERRFQKLSGQIQCEAIHDFLVSYHQNVEGLPDNERDDCDAPGHKDKEEKEEADFSSNNGVLGQGAQGNGAHMVKTVALDTTESTEEPKEPVTTAEPIGVLPEEIAAGGSAMIPMVDGDAEQPFDAFDLIDDYE
ncbi:hypothetical protein BV898_15050 [Hypsibius exemplaris]|uniref:Uncharacterized protein n=1 Tax=Hypsibius exemplaris TaxID=2072580 RepID=A0A9X6N9V6_HYPEX|nr:hypothetical protein BV898_15050 [Hypsibius exemplaris]